MSRRRLRLLDRLPDRLRFAVGIENRAFPFTFRAARTDRLDQRALRAQKALLVRIQDRHQGDLRNIEPFAQKIDPHQDIEGPPRATRG